MSASGKIVTLIIHGTFAREDTWWRLGADGEETFADRLEAALARRGLAWTVWRPALREGFDYDDFAWTGRNRHGDRMRGARKLRRGLAALAEKLGATRREPLTVNFVAHSHGGNVVLEALQSLPAGVRVGRVAFLGTPLLAVQPALRILRAAIALLLLLTVMVLWIDVGIYVVDLLTPGTLVHAEDIPAWGYGPALLGVAIGVSVLYGLLASELALIFDVLWRAVLSPLQHRWAAWSLVGVFAAWIVAASIFPALQHPEVLAAAVILLFTLPVMARFGWRWAEAVYGPRPAVLHKLLGWEPLVLLTSRQDEAALLLQFSSAPEQLYVAEIRHRIRGVGRPWSPLLRALEYLTLRPAVVGLALKVLEVAFERVALGMGLFNLLFFDYGMADLAAGRAYPANRVVRRVDVTAELKPAVAVMPDPLGVDPNRSIEELRKLAPHVRDRHAASLRETLVEVVEYLKAQIKFRHTLYYETPSVVERVAALLTADGIEP